ncbi:MAG: DUF4276 family protein [Defluviitaleaceae bacterium]|nr:DUF4276 family protein [Defluviitaleaceae bacterium]
MKIAILVEGKTEIAFKPHLIKFLQARLQGMMPKLDFHPFDGRIPTNDKLKRVVENHLNGQNPANHVIALTDVYTGTKEFKNATDAKDKMRQWVGAEPRFHPQVALHDFEAWLLPFWATILKLAQHNKKAPSGEPESVNHHKPPAHRIKEVFEIGKCRSSYVKTRDANRILNDNDLSISVNQCPELKAFINTIIGICGGNIIP